MVNREKTGRRDSVIMAEFRAVADAREEGRDAGFRSGLWFGIVVGCIGCAAVYLIGRVVEALLGPIGGGI